MLLLLSLIISTCFVHFTKSTLLERRQACEETLPICSPHWNQTWYHHKHYTFAWNQNYTLFVNSYISTFDLHLLTQLTSNGTERTVKSWFNLTNNADLQVEVTDDWFPNSLPMKNNTGPSISNKTWTLYAFVLPHNTVLPPSIDVSNKNELIAYEPYTQFYVVQLPPTPVIVNKEKLSHKWIIAIIVIACVIVIVALAVSIWFWKNMQKSKIHSSGSHHSNLQQLQHQQQQSSILSTPDAMMIADTFRQVMSTSDLDKTRRNQVGEDLLRRELESEGTSVLQVERRTASTKKN